LFYCPLDRSFALSLQQGCFPDGSAPVELAFFKDVFKVKANVLATVIEKL
jgi:hypothetical protein